ncbi:MAG: hypothetical protein ACR2RB_09885 [Gammaproteobacteria bacterium]
MSPLILLLVVTVCYAGYNLFIKVSGGFVPAVSTTTVLATICLQLAALATSLTFMALLIVRGGHVLQLSAPAYTWAAVAGLCIGIAEVCYFYVFGGLGNSAPMQASIAIPTIVCGTVVITAVVSYFVFRESLSATQLSGAALVMFGIALMFLGQK